MDAQISKIPAIDEFLRTFAKSIQWKEKDCISILRKLCEEYWFSPGNHSMAKVAYGYFLGKTGDDVKATVWSGYLLLDLENMYKVVAKENKWN